jgi:ubiquinone/menaquinone biosynthesis C-methylase UbiE
MKRKTKVKEYFESLSNDYSKYRNKNKYYWNDAVDYYNYYLTGTESILQVGCGTGETLDLLKGSTKVGIDFSEGMIAQAKSNFPSIEFEVMDAEDITLSKTFDVIILSNVVGYFDNILNVLESLKVVSHSRTKIFVHHYSRLWQPVINVAEFVGFKKKAPQQNWLSLSDMKNIMYLGGYDTFRSNMRVLFPVYVPLVSNFFNKVIANLPLFNSLCLSQHIVAKPFNSNNVEAKPSVSVIIPARNESGNIKDALERTPKMGSHTEIIFVEGNSTDDTWQEIQRQSDQYADKWDIKVAQQPGKGKYDAVKVGFDLATNDILMILDADLTVPPEDLPKFYDALVTGKGEFINGSRLVYPMEEKAMRFLNMLGNKFFSIMFSWLLEQDIKDTLCGTKVLYRVDYEKLAANRKYFGDFDPFGDFDLLFGAYKLNLKIIDLPIRYQERTYGDTNISRFRHGMILLRMVVFATRKIKLN